MAPKTSKPGTEIQNVQVRYHAGMTSDIDRLTGPHVWRGRGGCSPHAVLATGFGALDERLGGGWPWGAAIEIYAERYGVGELSVLMPALASLARRKPEHGWIVWVAPPMLPYAPALARQGVDPERVLLVRPPAGDEARAPGAGFPSGNAAGDALWATEQALRSGASAAVLAWLASVNDTALRRLQLAAEAQGCGLVLFRPDRARRQRSAAALRLRVRADGGGARVEVLKRRGGRPDVLRLDLSAGRPPVGAAVHETHSADHPQAHPESKPGPDSDFSTAT